MAASAWTPVDESAAGWTPVQESEPAKPSTGERLTRGYNPDMEAWAEKHPVLGVPARFLDSAGGAAMNFLPSIYHAFNDPLTDEEKANFQGHSRIPGEVVLERLTGAEAGVGAAKDYASGKVDLKGALSVLPEALGAGTGTVAAGTAAGQAAGAAAGQVPALARGAKPAIGATLRAAGDIVDPEITGIISPRLAHLQRVAGRIGKAMGSAKATAPVSEAPAAEDFEGITSPQTEAAGTQSEAEPEPEKAAAAAAAPLQPTKPAPDTSPKSVQSQINDALGGRPLVRGVSLKNQPSAQATAAGKLPEGYTPVNSTLLKGYKYDPGAQEFSAILQDGQSYTHGNVNPDQVAAFEGANSKGNGWTKAIKQGPGTVLVRKNGRPVIKPMPREAVAESPEQTPEQPSTDDLMKQLQDSLAYYEKLKAAKSQ